ncbi:MAG TPA: hypothetical protein VHE61_05450 [Opitutaceae bacterium]|nr:hypothetical protein [Opitutaceae bacterium]
MFSLAVATTTLDRLQHVAPAAWTRIGIAVLALVAVVIVLRKVAKINKLILAIVVCLAASFVGFNWIYQGNEPDWARPVIEPLTKFFPTKDSMK